MNYGDRIKINLKLIGFYRRILMINNRAEDGQCVKIRPLLLTLTGD